MRKIFLGLSILLFGFSLSANAGSGTGKIKYIKYLINQNLLVIVPETHQSKPSCVGWQHSMGIQYNNTEQAKAMLTMLLAAQAAGKQVVIGGSGSCFSNDYPFEVMTDIEIPQ